jgi:hypothetical protein
MNTTLHITALLEKPDFLEDLVEKLAQRRNETGYGNAKVPDGLAALEVSSTEAYVNGDVSLKYTDSNGQEECINMPFITCFMFTCKKPKGSLHKVSWSTSLS